MKDRLVYFEDFFDLLTKDIEKVFSVADAQSIATKFGYSCPNFPPTNVYAAEDKTLTYEFALAGYGKERVDVTFEANEMILTLKAPVGTSGGQWEAEKKKKGKMIYHRLKIVDSIQKYHIPNDKYIFADAKADMKDGLLTVTIPPKEPQKVTINF